MPAFSTRLPHLMPSSQRPLGLDALVERVPLRSTAPLARERPSTTLPTMVLIPATLCSAELQLKASVQLPMKERHSRELTPGTAPTACSFPTDVLSITAC